MTTGYPEMCVWAGGGGGGGGVGVWGGAGSPLQ